jgi:hypothetical protein
LRRPDALDHALGLRDWAALAEERDLVSPAETRTREQSVDLAASGHRFRYSFFDRDHVDPLIPIRERLPDAAVAGPAVASSR